MKKTKHNELYHRTGAFLFAAALLATLLLTQAPGCTESNGNGNGGADPFDRTGNPVNAGKEVTKTAPGEDCFWITSIGTGDGWNVFYPGASMYYPLSGFDVPDGAELRFEGEFPHSRFFSFTMYYPGLGESTGIGGSQALVDIAIEADPGSVNPFLDGADRDAENRSYTIYFREGNLPEDPADRETNTLYLGREFPIAQLRHAIGLRVYLPDMDTNAVGGVPLRSRTVPNFVARTRAPCSPAPSPAVSPSSRHSASTKMRTGQLATTAHSTRIPIRRRIRPCGAESGISATTSASRSRRRRSRSSS